MFRFGLHALPHAILRAALPFSLLVVAGCGPREKAAGDPGSSAPAPTSARIAPDERERLLALGYLDFSEEVAAGRGSGTVRYDPARSYPGYNLYTSRTLRLTELIDAGGRVLRRWQRETSGVWVRAALQPEGDLLVLGWHTRRQGPGSRYLMRLTWTGEVRWKRDLAVHHDVAPAPGGRLIALTLRSRSLPELHPDLPVRDDGLALLSPAGEVLETRSLYDMMRGRTRLARARPHERGQKSAIDYFHSNAVRWLDDEALEARSPLFSRRNVLVTIRNLDAVAIFDWDAAELLWLWGPGEISGPHDATLLANGNLLVFDNGVNRAPPWSRVIEIDPLTRQIEWEYRAPDPPTFFTLSRGSNQRLPNGNTLIAESDSGRAFEVTIDGEVVWEYLNPHLGRKGKRATIVRLYRYEEEFVHAIQRISTFSRATPRRRPKP